MGLGFLLVVSLAFTAALSALGDVLGNSAVLQIAVLFEVGRFAIGFYLGRSHPGNAFGKGGDPAAPTNRTARSRAPRPLTRHEFFARVSLHIRNERHLAKPQYYKATYLTSLDQNSYTTVAGVWFFCGHGERMKKMCLALQAALTAFLVAPCDQNKIGSAAKDAFLKLHRWIETGENHR